MESTWRPRPPMSRMPWLRTPGPWPLMRSRRSRRRLLMLSRRTSISMIWWPEPTLVITPRRRLRWTRSWRERRLVTRMETDAEKADAEAGNLEQAWQMFDLAKVIYGKAGDVAKECESL